MKKLVRVSLFFIVVLLTLSPLVSCSFFLLDEFVKHEDEDEDYDSDYTYPQYIQYFPNGGTGTMKAQDVKKGETVHLQPNAFIRQDHAFAGWAKAELKRVVYRDQDPLTMGEDGYSVILYAIWQYSGTSMEDLSTKSTSMESMTNVATVDGNGYLLAYDGTAYKQALSVDTYFPHRISPFSIGTYEVTYELWYLVRTWAQANGYSFEHFGREGSYGSKDNAPTPSGGLKPVSCISWRDALVWCNAYSEMTGKTPVYYSDYQYTLPVRNVIDVHQHGQPDTNRNADGYRLPTEGEWQYAASCGGSYPCNYASGATTFFYSVSDDDDDGIPDGLEANDAVAVYRDDLSNDDGLALVGTRLPNAFGLYDMSGNAFELCADLFESTLPGFSATDYTGPTIGEFCSIRGGSSATEASKLQIGFRESYEREFGRDDCGFRIVRSE